MVYWLILCYLYWVQSPFTQKLATENCFPEENTVSHNA